MNNGLEIKPETQSLTIHFFLVDIGGSAKYPASSVNLKEGFFFCRSLFLVQTGCPTAGEAASPCKSGSNTLRFLSNSDTELSELTSSGPSEDR